MGQQLIVTRAVWSNAFIVHSMPNNVFAFG